MATRSVCWLTAAALLAGCAWTAPPLNHNRLEPVRIEARISMAEGSRSRDLALPAGSFSRDPSAEIIADAALDRRFVDTLRSQLERNPIGLEQIVCEVMDSEMRQSGKFRITQDPLEWRTTARATVTRTGPGATSRDSAQPGQTLEIRVELVDAFGAVLWRYTTEIRPGALVQAAQIEPGMSGPRQLEAAWRAATRSAIAVIVQKM